MERVPKALTHSFGSVPYFSGLWRAEDTAYFCRCKSLLQFLSDLEMLDIPVAGEWIVCHSPDFSWDSFGFPFYLQNLAEQKEIDGEATALMVLLPLPKFLFLSKRLAVYL